MVRAQLRARNAEHEACILDISTRGLSATSAHPPTRGDYIELAVGQHNIIGQVKWSSERRFGVAFRERISVIAAISGKGNLALPGHRQAARVSLQRNSDGSLTTGSRLEFYIFAAAAALAVFIITNYASTTLSLLEIARSAVASPKVSG